MGQVVLNGVVLVSRSTALRSEELRRARCVETGPGAGCGRPHDALIAALGLLPAALSTQIGSKPSASRGGRDRALVSRDASSRSSSCPSLHCLLQRTSWRSRSLETFQPCDETTEAEQEVA